MCIIVAIIIIKSTPFNSTPPLLSMSLANNREICEYIFWKFNGFNLWHTHTHASVTHKCIYVYIWSMRHPKILRYLEIINFFYELTTTHHSHRSASITNGTICLLFVCHCWLALLLAIDCCSFSLVPYKWRRRWYSNFSFS